MVPLHAGERQRKQSDVPDELNARLKNKRSLCPREHTPQQVDEDMRQHGLCLVVNDTHTLLFLPRKDVYSPATEVNLALGPPRQLFV